MKLSDPNRLLRGFGLARLAVAALLLAVGPMLPEDLMPDANRPVLALTLLAVVLTSGALTFYSPVAKPHRIAWLVCLGLAFGIPMALILGHFIADLLYGLRPTDPLTIVIGTLVILIVSLFAGYVPARRASRVDPMVSLRCE